MTEDEEQQELRETLERVRERVAECIAIVDELFPEDERKPQSTTSGRQWMQSSTRGDVPVSDE